MSDITIDNKRAAMNFLIGKLQVLRDDFRAEETLLELRISKLAHEIEVLERAYSAARQG